jgi:hypothetical protein
MQRYAAGIRYSISIGCLERRQRLVQEVKCDCNTCAHTGDTLYSSARRKLLATTNNDGSGSTTIKRRLLMPLQNAAVARQGFAGTPGPQRLSSPPPCSLPVPSRPVPIPSESARVAAMSTKTPGAYAGASAVDVDTNALYPPSLQLELVQLVSICCCAQRVPKQRVG